ERHRKDQVPQRHTVCPVRACSGTWVDNTRPQWARQLGELRGPCARVLSCSRPRLRRNSVSPKSTLRPRSAHQGTWHLSFFGKERFAAGSRRDRRGVGTAHSRNDFPLLPL